MLFESESPRTSSVTVVGVLREVRRRLAGGVPRADDADVLAPHRRAPRCLLRRRRRRRRSATRASGSRGAATRRPSRARRRVRSPRCPSPTPIDEPVLGGAQRRDLLCEDHVRPEQPRLLAGAVGEVVAADAPREAGEVADARARAGLAAGDRAARRRASRGPPTPRTRRPRAPPGPAPMIATS